jgi:hypothetical protein
MRAPHLPIVAIALALGVGSVACGSTDPGAPSTLADDAGSTLDGAAPDAGAGAPTSDAAAVDPRVAARAFRTDVAKAVCAKLAGCCSQADRDAYFGQFRDKPYELASTPSAAECEVVLAQTLGKLHDKWIPSVERGAVAFDGAKAAACVDAVKTAACGVPLASALFGENGCWGPRGKVFTKKLALGAACENIGDGTYYGECDPAVGFCGNVSKKCEPWKRTNEDCTIVGTWAFCAPGLNCDNATPSRPGKCSAPPVTVAIGQSCTALSGPTTLCAADAFCNYTSGKCEAKKADGATCQYDDECQTGHPFSCSPFGAGTCGKRTFCAGSN